VIRLFKQGPLFKQEFGMVLHHRYVLIDVFT